ncbi:hydroxymethylglutaryl-CoA synthase [Saitoella complicata NRRL Y-17804]|nr:hydroxymethylglutaryl-CoA synthase [Saitoella complicata NRRL Y-17804]ODQ49915.1 hydroxymethylglutaryl-CoA synthase [Saitoella complicata NRRL Y-17804]
MSRPQNVGILGMEFYFPNQCVDQADLESFDGVAAGKYTIGLGQKRMASVDDREDIYSFALTATHNLIEKYNIDVNTIGRVEVGTETLLDKSKSVKSVLMQLFGENHDIEGVDTVNACYGGTNAFFNAVNWIESSAWDGRNAIVVAGDIAIYAKGAARPTGGAGCVAMLIGPDAPIVLDAGVRGTHMAHVYDFYKPDFTSEYPYVEGHYSVQCYTRALDSAYRAYQKKFQKKYAKDASIDTFDYCLFHAPTCKTVQKSYGRLLYNDFLASPSTEEFASVKEAMEAVDYDASLSDKNVEKTFVTLSKGRYGARVQPTILAPNNLGNSYTACVYSCLASLLSSVPASELTGKRVGAFSYGSGMAATFFSLSIVGDVSRISETLALKEKLDAMKVLKPEAYEHNLELREKAHLSKDFTPVAGLENVRDGTYYLVKVDEKYRRFYERKGAAAATANGVSA